MGENGGAADTVWATEVTAERGAPSDARVFLRSVLADRIREERLDTATLLASELVSNAVLHGTRRRGGTIRVGAWMADERIHIEVTDRGPGFDRDEALTRPGFGLRLVRDLSAGWGADRRPDGWTVWFEL
ncbi:MAG TPA: ATP-binding protein [Actinomycetota bacterium]|nr:ATP-binding protein [Actinomycetota bacterium]